MKRFILPLLLALTCAHAADFDQTSWRTQLYLQAAPYDPLVFKGTLGADDPEFESSAPAFSGGILWSPLITPFWKADLPFTFWIGGEVGAFRFGELKGKGIKLSEFEDFTYSAYMPAVVGGFSYNLAGDWDLKLLGGYGQQKYTFTDEYASTVTYERSATAAQAFASATIEYRIIEVFKGVDFKVGLNIRKEFLAVENLTAVDAGDAEIPPALDGLKFSKVEADVPVRIGLELSLDIGRESRRDRKMRFKLRDRTNVLRDNNKGRDTLSEWDCMAIERDYRFFLEEDGNLPDVRHKYTKSQYSDVLESFLAFCRPEDQRTREALFASLDSNKVELKRYQVSQEDARYKQVMASNDVKMMQMFVQYYPQSRFRPNIESKIRVLQDYKDFKEARTANTFQSFLSYLVGHPDGHYRKEAETGIFALVKAGNRIKDYEIYLKKFPDGLFVNEARRAIHQLEKSGHN